ncbi:MAG: hypothetical protein K2X47_16680 [Bdellovibrionales bacterium]|nr:hypothetical protein [Bdellovibrionales bacterium]
MANYYKDLSEEQKNLAQEILNSVGLEGLTVSYEPQSKALRFVQDRRTIAVPLDIVKAKRWADIRFLFRACLGKAPANWNHGSPNDWGPQGDPYKKVTSTPWEG